jgi:hypothetical protein
VKNDEQTNYTKEKNNGVKKNDESIFLCMSSSGGEDE